jgi:hypothetical protein
MDVALSKARTFGIISLVFGLIAPGLFIIAWLFFSVLITGTGGFGALGFAAVFELGAPVFSFLIAIPLGIIAIVFAIKALSTIKPLGASKAPYIFPLCLGVVNIIFPFLLAVWLIPPGACIYDRNPGNAGCLALPIIPLSWQVSPQYLEHLQNEENAPAGPSVTYPVATPMQTYTNQSYRFSVTYPFTFSLSIQSSSNASSESITFKGLGTNGGSVTLFINQSYPSAEEAGAIGVATAHFNASDTLGETDFHGTGEYSESGTYNPPIAGYDLVAPFTDAKGNTYYWRDDFNNWQTAQTLGQIEYSMKSF